MIKSAAPIIALSILLSFARTVQAEESDTAPIIENQIPSTDITDNTDKIDDTEKKAGDENKIPENAFSAQEPNNNPYPTADNTDSKLEALEKEIQQHRDPADWDTTDSFFSAEALLGLQTDSINWTVKQGSVTEKTKWDDIQSTLLGVQLNTTLNKRLHAHIDYHTSLSHEGDGTDTLNSPTTNLSGTSDDGSYERYSLGIRYDYHINDALTIGPRLGYFESNQAYNFYNKDITGPSLDSASEALNSQFDVIWNGMLVGCGGSYIVNDQLSIFASIDISILDYENKGQLNLRPTLKRDSLKQSGDGTGLDISLGVRWAYNEKLTLIGLLRFADWDVDGDEKRYTTSGSTITSDLSEAHFSSLLLSLGVDYAF